MPSIGPPVRLREALRRHSGQSFPEPARPAVTTCFHVWSFWAWLRFLPNCADAMTRTVPEAGSVSEAVLSSAWLWGRDSRRSEAARGRGVNPDGTASLTDLAAGTACTRTRNGREELKEHPQESPPFVRTYTCSSQTTLTPDFTALDPTLPHSLWCSCHTKSLIFWKYPVAIPSQDFLDSRSDTPNIPSILTGQDPGQPPRAHLKRQGQGSPGGISPELCSDTAQSPLPARPSGPWRHLSLLCWPRFWYKMQHSQTLVKCEN